MTWLKLDDLFPWHRKIRPLSDGAFRVHVEAKCWASHNLTDGAIPPADLRHATTRPRPQRFVQTLISAGIWHDLGTKCASEECVDSPDTYVIHDFLAYNPSAEQVRQERRSAAERQRRKRESSRGESRRDSPNGHAVSHGGSHATPTRTRKELPPTDSSPALVPDAREQDQPRGEEDEIPEGVLRGLRRAGHVHPPDGWAYPACARVVGIAANTLADQLDQADRTQEAWDRLEVLAALDDTRSPGRLLEPVGWELAGRDLARIRVDDRNRETQLAEREARNRGTTGCEHGHPLGGDLCVFCRTGTDPEEGNDG